MQLGDGVGSIKKDFAPSRVTPTGISPACGSNTPINQSAGVLGDIGEGEAAFALGRLAAASGQEPTEPAITMAVHRPEQDRAGIDHRDFGSDDQLEAGLPGRDVGADRAGQTVPIGDGHPGIAELGGLGDQLVGMRRPFQEREVRLAVKLDITDRRRRPREAVPQPAPAHEVWRVAVQA